MTRTSSRLSRFSEVLQAEGADAFFASAPISMGYLAGFPEDGHERLLVLAIRPTGEVRLICPSLTANQAERCGIKDIASFRDGEDPYAHIKKLGEDWGLKSGVIAVDSTMRADILLGLQQTLPAALFKAGATILSSLMAVKEPSELALMKKAAGIADQSISAGLTAIKPGATEEEVAMAINNKMKELGGKPAFCIVATGANGAEPHHLTDDSVIKQGDVIILDFGCTVEGYYSDITRTVACGEPGAEAHKVYGIVHQAHEAARIAAILGASGAEVDWAARKVIEDAGYGEFFVHRTGHGIGAQGHEEPNIVSTNVMPLEEGNCFSIEPGIYLPGKLGVRLENIYAMGSAKAESFNEAIPQNLIIL